MGFVAAKCTNCGANIKVDENKDAGICQHCATAFVTEKVINNYVNNYNIEKAHIENANINMDISDKLKENYYRLIKRAIDMKKVHDVYEYSNKLYELNPDNMMAYSYKLVSRYIISKGSNQDIETIFEILDRFFHSIKDKNDKNDFLDLIFIFSNTISSNFEKETLTSNPEYKLYVLNILSNCVDSASMIENIDEDDIEIIETIYKNYLYSANGILNSNKINSTYKKRINKKYREIYSNFKDKYPLERIANVALYNKIKYISNWIIVLLIIILIYVFRR